jgi:hypothetical protein
LSNNLLINKVTDPQSAASRLVKKEKNTPSTGEIFKVEVKREKNQGRREKIKGILNNEQGIMNFEL